jgi:hypothetical protein
MPKNGILLSARVFDRVDHPLNPALAESAGDQDSVGMLQAQRRGLARIDLLRFDPFDHGALFVREPAVDQGFAQTLVGVFELHVLAHHRDAHLPLRIPNAIE